MFDTIKGIIGDIATGAIKDQRILLSEQQLAALDLKLHESLRDNELLLSENKLLRDENLILRAENARLAQRAIDLDQLVRDRDTQIQQIAEANQRQRQQGRRSEEEEKVLLMLTNGRKRTLRDLANERGAGIDATEAMLNSLADGDEGLVYETVHHGYAFEEHSPSEWWLTRDGKAYLARYNLIQ